SYFYYHEYYDNIGSVISDYVKNSKVAKELINKYYDHEEFSPIFLDFVFGEYSNYGNQYMSETLYEGEIIQPEDFDFYDHVFIEKASYDEFDYDISRVSKQISNFLKKQL
ncbi:hypothetical protein N9502_03910, partial [Vicingaceae bacterium]|nr:hypothetical protein [Vicingaceae bacterium]